MRMCSFLAQPQLPIRKCRVEPYRLIVVYCGGGRRVNLLTPKCDCCRPDYVEIEDIVEEIVRLSRPYRRLGILINKREVKADCKLVRVRPDGVELFLPNPLEGSSAWAPPRWLSTWYYLSVGPAPRDSSQTSRALSLNGALLMYLLALGIRVGPFASFLFAAGEISVGPNLGTRC